MVATTPNKADYEQVPNVDQERLIPVPKVDPRTTYPEADEIQARLLGDLDEVIKLSNPKVELPRIKASTLSAKSPTTWKELLQALKIPTQAFLATVVAALMTIVWGSPLVQQAFPYVACIIEFAATVPALIERFTKQSDVAFETLDECDGAVDAQLDAVAFKVEFVVDSIQDLVKQVLEPVRPKLSKARKLESTLQKYDDSIDIPDPDDIERELDGCSGQVKVAMETVKSSIDIGKFIPLFFRSKENFIKYVVYPILAVFLALQIYGVYQSSQAMQSESDVSVDETPVAGQVRRFLRGSVEEQIDEMVEEARMSTTGEVSEDVSWYPLWAALQVYVSAIAEILIGFVLSQAAMIAATLNIAIGRVEHEVNDTIESSGASQVFDDYLTTKMEALRAKLLKLVQNMIKVDKVQEKIAGDVPSMSMVGELADSAKAKMEDATKKRPSFSLPWSPFGKKE